MTKKEILNIIAANPGKALYLNYGDLKLDNSGARVSLHVPVSKTSLLKNWKYIRAARVSTYNQERPDLAKKYADRGGVTGGEQMIVTFDATKPIA